MEGIADQPMHFSGTTDQAGSPSDLREERYQLANRLADNLWLGEAIRVLEALGDYRDSLALLSEYRAMKAYSDDVDARPKEERRRQAMERTRRENERRRRRIAIGAVTAIALAVALTFIR